MKIDYKIFYISLFLFVIFTAIFQLIVPYFVMRSFYVLEDSQSAKIQDSIKKTVSYQIDYLDSVANTLSVSNNFYNNCMPSDSKDGKVSQEITKDIIKKININYLVLVSPTGEIIYNEGAITNSKTIKIPDDLIIRLINTSKVSKKFSGLLEFPSYEVATVSVKPISQDNNIVGYVIAGKILDKKIANSFGGEDYFTIEKINDPSAPDSYYTSFLKEDFFDKRENDHLYAYSSYKDIFGNRIFYSKISIPRDIYRVGTSQLEIISYSVFISQLLMMIVFFVIVEKIVTRRIKLLTESVEATNRRGEKNKIVVFGGDDEIATLSSEASKTFEKIQKTKNEAQMKQRQLDSILNSMHDSVYIFNKNNDFISAYIFNGSNKIKSQKNIILPRSIKIKLAEAVAKIKEGKGLQNIEYSTLVGKESHWYSANISERLDKGGNFDGIIVVARDVTAGKNMENGIKSKLSELEKLNHLMVGRELKMIELKKKIKDLESNK